MNFKKLKSGIRIPVLGLGTWTIGGYEKADTRFDKENITAIKSAIKTGFSHIDTAEYYGAGHSEELVGKAIKAFERSDIFITTKVSQENLRYNDVLAALNKSLKRLKTNYVDLYLIHYPNPEIPIKETMRAMDYLVEKKHTKFIGVSNFSIQQIKDAQKHAKNKIIANQIEYNLITRKILTRLLSSRLGRISNINIEPNMLRYCEKNDIIIIAYKPLARGILAKKGIEILDKMGKKYEKTPAQIALNWLISKPNVITIPKTTSVDHMIENLGAIGWSLSKEDMNRLDSEFPQKI